MDPPIWGFVRRDHRRDRHGYFTNRGERIRAEKDAQLDGAKRRVPDEDLGNRYRLATFRVITLRSRVADPDVRVAADAFIEAAGLVVNAANADAAKGAITASSQIVGSGAQGSGDLIKATFVGPA